jgi:hypothetical protein
MTSFPIKFRIVFWDVLPCKIIVDRRLRGTYCLHHQYIPEDNSELHSRRCENLKSHTVFLLLQIKVHPSQHGFITSKSTVINLITYLNKVTSKSRCMLYTSILAKPLIKFPILYCFVNLKILASHHDTSPGSKITYPSECLPFV